MEPILIVAGIVLFGAVIGYLLARNGLTTAFVTLLVAILGFALWAIVKAQGAQGWDGLGYVILGVIFLAPAGVGQCLGGAFGLYRRRKSRQMPKA